MVRQNEQRHGTGQVLPHGKRRVSSSEGGEARAGGRRQECGESKAGGEGGKR